MKRNYLNLFLSFCLLVTGATAFTSCSDDDNEITYLISLSELPQDAQTFLATYFPNENAAKVEKQSIGDIIMYQVEMDNGFEIMFNSKGDWQEVDAPDGKTLPVGIAPEAIQNYVDTNYPDYGINEINKTGNGYNVELVSGPELEFNLLGEFVRVISDF